VRGADPRLDAIDRELAVPLESAREAEERVWAALRVTPRPRPAPFFGLAIGLAAVVALLLAIGWTQGVRVGVASGGLPTLYRLEIGRVELDTPDARGTLAVGERYLRDPNRLSAVADASLRIQQAALPAEVEVRFLEQGQTAHGVLARTARITDAGRDGVRITHEAPFPPLARGERRTYRVWLHLTFSHGERSSPRLVVEVSGAAEGQRVRYIATE